MTNFKNISIAVLTGLLALSLFIEPAQSATKKSKEAKMIEYAECLRAYDVTGAISLEGAIFQCAKFRP
jgi:hypothetical protein